MREIKFEGALTPDTFKEFFLIYDALLPLEWRVNYLHGKTIADFGNYFERIICRDDILNLDSWYNDHAQEMYISLLLHKQWHRQIAKLVNNYNFKGVDELPCCHIPDHDIALVVPTGQPGGTGIESEAKRPIIILTSHFSTCASSGVPRRYTFQTM